MRWLPQVLMTGVFLLAGSLQAGNLTLTATDNGNGTLTLGIDSFIGDPPVGIALTLDPNSHSIRSLIRGLPYYDIITVFDPNSNQIIAFAALATLGVNDPFPAQIPNLITLDFGGPATGVIQEDILRGGMVDTQGRLLASNLPLAFTVTGNSCTCYGDVADSLATPGSDGLVDFGDINLIVSAATPSGFNLKPIPEHLICADLSDSLQTPGPDGIIDFGDINYLVGQLSAANFSTTCLTLP